MGGLRGYDGNKRLVGRKRHILVDTQGFLLSVVVHAGSVPDRKGGQRVLEAAGDAYPRLHHIWAHQGYTGTLVRWAAQEYGWTVQVVYPQDRQLKRYAPDVLDESGFKVIPKRWIVERTFGWLSRCRRMSKDYERKVQTSETLIELAMIRLLLVRIGQHP